MTRSATAKAAQLTEKTVAPYKLKPKPKPKVVPPTVQLPTVDNVLQNPSEYFILVSAKINFGQQLHRFNQQPYRTSVYAIHRKENGLPSDYIKKFEDILKSPHLALFTEIDEEDDDREGLEESHRRKVSSFLHGLCKYLDDLAFGRSNDDQKEQGIFSSTKGSVISQFIDLAQRNPPSVHLLCTVFADNLQQKYWGFNQMRYDFPYASPLSEPFRLPTDFDADRIRQSALAINFW